jgi:predicted small metal-binding protein
MDDPQSFTNRCACGWEVTGTEEEVVDATIEHGRRIHNMEATREQVLTALHDAATTTDAVSESAAG